MQYWRIANSDGKVWLMPRRNTRVALALYQPSGWRGKVLKALLPFCSALPRRCAPFPIIEWDVDDPTRGVLSRIFAGRALEWARFDGTPSVHQKQVLQVFCGQEILAYCKVTDREEIKELFAREAELLHDLRARGIDSIPRCLYLGAVGGEGRQMMILSTEKTLRSPIPHDWTAWHQSFVDELQQKTAQMIPFEQCDLAQGIWLLRERREVLPACVDMTALERAMRYAEDCCQGRTLACAVAHGDFTPWNMFVAHDRLFVFDWEYAFLHCPVGMDRYHFLTQTAFFERHWTAEELMAYVQAPEGAWIDTDQLLFYFILIMSRFVGREPIDRKMPDSELLAYWNSLIILCLKKK